jgi:hypothetical protein
MSEASNTASVLPELPEGFDFVTTIQYGHVTLALRDYRDQTTADFKRREAIKDGSHRHDSLKRYGVCVAKAEVKNEWQLRRQAKKLARLAWLASIASENGHA